MRYTIVRYCKQLLYIIFEWFLYTFLSHFSEKWNIALFADLKYSSFRCISHRKHRKSSQHQISSLYFSVIYFNTIDINVIINSVIFCVSFLNFFFFFFWQLQDLDIFHEYFMKQKCVLCIKGRYAFFIKKCTFIRKFILQNTFSFVIISIYNSAPISLKLDRLV